VEIATPPPKYPLRSRLRFDFERALLEAAQDREMRGGAEGTTRPWRKPGLKWWFLRKVAVPAFRLMPWGLRNRMMRFVCGYPKGWQAAR
jgi:hypothetical protein